MLQPQKMNWFGDYPMPQMRQKEDQPTLADDLPVDAPQPQPRMRSVLDRNQEQEQKSEENIRRMRQILKGYHKPGMPYNIPY